MKNKQKLFSAIILVLALIGLVGFSFFQQTGLALNLSNQSYNGDILSLGHVNSMTKGGNQSKGGDQGGDGSEQATPQDNGGNSANNQMQVADKILCSYCNGKGTYNYYKCAYCGNRDITTDQKFRNPGPLCSECGRPVTYFVGHEMCPVCKGTGWVKL